MDRIMAILDERKRQHGNFADCARYTQDIKQILQSSNNWFTLDAMHREALEMIAAKIGRILVGDPFYADHWDDIAGYAMLASGKPKIEKLEPPKLPDDWLVRKSGELKG